MLTHILTSRFHALKPMRSLLLAAGLAMTASVSAAETFDLRIANFVAPSHPINLFFKKWSEELETASNGELKFEIFPSAQLGPVPGYFDLARRGQADIAWVLHGATPSRFPLTELSNLPFLFCSGEQASKVLNDPELRAEYLDGEHDGVKVLSIHAHVPGHLWTAGKKVETVSDLSGLAIRPASRTIGAFVAALGAASVGIAPNELAEAMEKGTADGGFMDYPAGAYSFRLGAVTDYIAEMSAYTTSFSIVMNERAFNGLPEHLQELIETSFEGREAEIGGGWDNLVDKAKTDLAAEGVEIYTLTPEALAEFKAVGARVTQDWLAQLDKDGHPASAAYARMQELAAQYAGESADFCQ